VLFEGAARYSPGDGSAALENGAILAERGTITRIARNGEIAPPAGPRGFDLAGKTVMAWPSSPLMCTRASRGGLTYVAENFKRETILDDLNRALYFGVSTVMSQGVERGEVMYQIRTEQAEGRLGGARLMLLAAAWGRPMPAPAIRSTLTSPTR